MKKVKVLNLYAGIGGNRKNWKNVEVTAIENNVKIAKQYQEFFPNDNVIVADAHEYLLNNFQKFDFIWSSPPCPTHSKLAFINKPKFVDMKLYQEILLLKNFFKGFWVVENVIPYYKPLINANIQIDRHFFWSNFNINKYSLKRSFSLKEANKEELENYLDIYLKKNIYSTSHCKLQVLRNCVHPEIGEHIFKDFLKAKELKTVKQLTILEK